VSYVSELLAIAFDLKISKEEIEKTIKLGSTKIAKQSAL